MNNNFNKFKNQEKPTPKLPQNYLEGGYYKDLEKSVLDENYIIKFSKDIANNLQNEGRDKNKSSQVRKYYEYIARIKQHLKYEKDFDKVISQIQRLSYFVNYAKTRGKVGNLFVSFIEKNLENIKDKEDFMAFAIHFEAIMAYLPKD